MHGEWSGVDTCIPWPSCECMWTTLAWGVCMHVHSGVVESIVRHWMPCSKPTKPKLHPIHACTKGGCGFVSYLQPNQYPHHVSDCVPCS